MKTIVLLFTVGCLGHGVLDASAATNEGERTIRLQSDEGVTVLTDQGIQVTIGNLTTNTCVLIKRKGADYVWLDLSHDGSIASIHTSTRDGARSLISVDHNGDGIPEFRRIMEKGKTTGFELFVNGHFVKPIKQGHKWIADGNVFVYRDGNFEKVADETKPTPRNESPGSTSSPPTR